MATAAEPIVIEPPLDVSAAYAAVPGGEGRDRTKAWEMLDKIANWATLTGMKQHFGLNQIAVANTLGKSLPPSGDGNGGGKEDGSVDLGNLNELIKNLDPAPFGTNIYVVDQSQGKPAAAKEPVQPPPVKVEPQKPVEKVVPTEPEQPVKSPTSGGLSRLAQVGILAGTLATGGALVGLGTLLNRPKPTHIEPIELEGIMKWEARNGSRGSVSGSRSTRR